MAEARDHERPVGLIAGQGDLPLLVARGIRASGRRVACIGLADQYMAELPALCDEFATAGVLRLGRWIRLARRFGVREAIMVGRVSKARMHDPLRLVRQIPDLRAINLWYRKLRHDRRSSTLLSMLADDLAKEGLVLIDSTTYIPEHMATLGVMTRREPTEMQRSDIEFAWPLLAQLGALDIGQAIAVREKDVIAVEAVEGTNRMIDRAGELCPRKGWTLVKDARRGPD
ncbi:MAG: LpxI family protein, partial [Phycisphaerales bacterium]